MHDANVKKNRFIPQIYLHPYEYRISEKLKVSKNKLITLGKKNAYFCALRQIKWLKFRNETLKFKLQNLLCTNFLEGNLYDLSLSIN